MYASRHDPFVYFHSIIDNGSLCNSHVVNLSDLPRDLSHVGGTRNYTFITPDLCSDGHDATCATGQTQFGPLTAIVSGGELIEPLGPLGSYLPGQSGFALPSRTGFVDVAQAGLLKLFRTVLNSS